MTRSRTLRRGAAVAGAAFLLVAGTLAPAQAALPRGERGTGCFDPTTIGAGAAAKGGHGHGADHREITAKEAKAIEARTKDTLAAKGIAPAKPAKSGKPLLDVTVPVYVHVMVAA